MQQQIFFYKLALIFFFSVFSLVWSQVPRNIWLKIERKNTAYAYQHLRCVPTDNNGFCYEITQLIKMDVIGMNPQEIRMSGRYWVTANLEPISFEFQSQSLAKQVKVRGNYDTGRMILQIQEDKEETRSEEIPFEHTYFSVVLEDLILKNQTKETLEVQLFESYERRISTHQIFMDRPLTGELNATVSGDIVQKYQFDSQGNLRQIDLVELRCRAWVTTEEDAKKIETLKTDDGFTLTVPTRNEIVNIEEVREAKIRVQWKNIPFEQFVFEDNRQRLLERKISGDTYEVILEIKKEVSSKKKLINLETSERERFLQETQYIKPFDLSIQKQLAEICGEEKDPVAVTQKILKWVYQFVEPELIAETLSGPEVLRQRRGKCVEYAILFASLTRAAGVPTKMVLGERHMGSHWMGHLWNEVWLGEWLCVDPSQGAFIESPSLLKFIDGPTLESTQSVRMKLIDNLSIEILEFTETASVTEIKTGIHGNTYSNKNFLCSISTPDSSWEITEETKLGSTIITLQPRQEKRVSVALVLFPIPSPEYLPYLLEMRLKAIEKKTKQFEILAKGQETIAELVALKVVFQHDTDTGMVINENYLFARDKMAYLLVFISAEDSLLVWRYSMCQMMETFLLY